MFCDICDILWYLWCFWCLVRLVPGSLLDIWIYLPSPDANYQGQDRRGNGERYRHMATMLPHTEVLEKVRKVSLCSGKLKLGHDHNRQAALRIFANQTTCRLWSLQASVSLGTVQLHKVSLTALDCILAREGAVSTSRQWGVGNKGNGQLKFFALLFTAWARACGGEAWGNVPPGHCSLSWILRVYGVKSW